MYKRLSYWKEYYARDDYPDNRSLIDFASVETNEVITAMRQELVGIAQGNYIEENLVIILGPIRHQRHGSFDAWAQQMLQWLAAANKS